MTSPCVAVYVRIVLTRTRSLTLIACYVLSRNVALCLRLRVYMLMSDKVMIFIVTRVMLKFSVTCWSILAMVNVFSMILVGIIVLQRLTSPSSASVRFMIVVIEV